MAFLTTHPDNAFEPWEISLAERLVRAFLISRAPGKLEFDDLLQECLLHWWQQRDRYSASRGASPQTFFRRVFRAKLLDIARSAQAQKRGGARQEHYLSEPLGPDDEDLLSDSIADDDPRGTPTSLRNTPN